MIACSRPAMPMSAFLLDFTRLVTLVSIFGQILLDWYCQHFSQWLFVTRRLPVSTKTVCGLLWTLVLLPLQHDSHSIWIPQFDTLGDTDARVLTALK